ncbi:Uncharacterised protein [uncultured archaeon]|nr:Uncharacterised protein [uncultured archaeon]
MHECKQTAPKYNSDGTESGQFYNYLCSRCGRCYVCKHKAVLFGDGTWHWKCPNGKFQELIFDWRIRA